MPVATYGIVQMDPFMSIKSVGWNGDAIGVLEWEYSILGLNEFGTFPTHYGFARLIKPRRDTWVGGYFNALPSTLFSDVHVADPAEGTQFTNDPFNDLTILQRARYSSKYLHQGFSRRDVPRSRWHTNILVNLARIKKDFATAEQAGGGVTDVTDENTDSDHIRIMLGQAFDYVTSGPLMPTAPNITLKWHVWKGGALTEHHVATGFPTSYGDVVSTGESLLGEATAGTDHDDEYNLGALELHQDRRKLPVVASIHPTTFHIEFVPEGV